VFLVEGVASVYCNKDLYLSFCFVLATFDRAFARMLSPFGMCCIFTSSKLKFMMLQIMW